MPELRTKAKVKLPKSKPTPEEIYKVLKKQEEGLRVGVGLYKAPLDERNRISGSVYKAWLNTKEGKEASKKEQNRISSKLRRIPDRVVK